MVMKSAPANNPDPNSTELKFKGVRKRKWGKWVSEIRLPHSRDRIWLGSYDSPIKAARAFDAAQLCLRGPSAANLNFLDNPPRIDGPTQGLTPAEIQLVATSFANAGEHQHPPPVEAATASTPSVSISISDGGVQCESGDESPAFDGGPSPVLELDYSDFNTLENLGSGNFDASFGLGDFYTSHLSDLSSDYNSDYNEYDSWNGSDLLLWNF